MKQVFVWALILGLQQLFCEWRWQSATRKKKYLWQCFSVFLQFAIILISFQFIDEKMAFFQHFSNGRKTKLGNTLEHVRKFDDLIKCWLRGDQKNVWLLFCFYQDSRYRDKQVIERLRSAELTCSVMFSQLLPNLHFISKSHWAKYLFWRVHEIDKIISIPEFIISTHFMVRS